MRYTGWHLWMTRLTKTPRAWRSNYSFKLLLGTVQPAADAVTIWASLFQVEMTLESESLPIPTDCSKSGVLHF